jgi:hypothetical protein
MSPLIEQLHDIEGLDAIGHWPLAIGWWVLIACALLVFGSALWLLSCRLKYLRSWKRDALKRLDSLERNLSLSTSGETIAFLSEYLRRIAMRRFPRKECAGIVGDAWLKWLKEQDPKQFNWIEKGRPLIEVPYAPVHKELYLNNLKNRNFDKEAFQNSPLERATIVRAQGASEEENFGKKPTSSKTDSSGCFGIPLQQIKELIQAVRYWVS